MTDDHLSDDRIDAELRRVTSELASVADPPADYADLTVAVITSYDKRSDDMQYRNWILAAAAVVIAIVLAGVALLSDDDPDDTITTETPTPVEQPTAVESEDATEPAPEPTLDDAEEPTAAVADPAAVAAAARNALVEDIELAMLLAAEAYAIDPSPANAGLLFDAIRPGSHQVERTAELTTAATVFPSPDGTMLATLLTTALFDLTQDPPASVDAEAIQAGNLTFFNDDGTLMNNAASGATRLDPRTLQVLNESEVFRGQGRVTEDGASLIVPSADGLVEIDLVTNEVTNSISLGVEVFVEITADGRFAVVSGPFMGDTPAQVVDLETFELEPDHPVARPELRGYVRLLAGDQFAAVTTVDLEMRLIALDSGEEVATIPGTRRFVNEDTTTSDGLLMSIDVDGLAAELHDPTTGAVVSAPIPGLYPGGGGFVDPFAFVPGGADMWVRTDLAQWQLWTMNAADWTAAACEAAGRILTEDERTEHGLSTRDSAC